MWFWYRKEGGDRLCVSLPNLRKAPQSWILLSCLSYLHSKYELSKSTSRSLWMAVALLSENLMSSEYSLALLVLLRIYRPSAQGPLHGAARCHHTHF